ncbi:PEP-CTERM sorting domain-containing protein [Aurantiacibacter xanthus]|nr:PEP-CTERM sorting domain-containing protein [Aurantiacibacter xanthus]
MPEPGMLVLFGAGAGALFLGRRRKARRKAQAAA